MNSVGGFLIFWWITLLLSTAFVNMNQPNIKNPVQSSICDACMQCWKGYFKSIPLHITEYMAEN